MDISNVDIIDVELTSGSVHRSFINHSIGKADKMANSYGVRLFRNGEAVNISGGSCSGFFMAPDGTNILISGSGQAYVSGNLAYVTLPQACYNVEGGFSLAIKVTDENDAVIGTMRIVDGVVNDTGTDNPQTTYEFPDYEDIEALVTQMLAAKAGSIRYDIEQELTSEERDQARENIGMVSIEFSNIENDEYLMSVSTSCEFENITGDEYMLVMHVD